MKTCKLVKNHVIFYTHPSAPSIPSDLTSLTKQMSNFQPCCDDLLRVGRDYSRDPYCPLRDHYVDVAVDPPWPWCSPRRKEGDDHHHHYRHLRSTFLHSHRHLPSGRCRDDDYYYSIWTTTPPRLQRTSLAPKSWRDLLLWGIVWDQNRPPIRLKI